MRLSMILENQGDTTRNKYICKLAECVIFDSDSTELSATEVRSEISNRFQLEFDLLEIKNAIKSKGKGRIHITRDKYSLEPKSINQLSNVISFEDKLNNFIEKYIKEKRITVDKHKLLSLIQNHLYYSFNSNAKNFTAIIGCVSTKHIDETIIDNYKILPEDKDLINGFLEWNNEEKDELFYNIVASCYEYCLITSKKNPYISKSLFKSKRFFLDTNMIFRMAGISNDERQIVIKTFVDKCREVGISLCYTNYVLDEIYRVIDKEIDFIRKVLTNGHLPINDKLLGSISSSFEPNDFYVKYYNWCKEPQNKHNDYQSFRRYLFNTVDSAIKEFTYVKAPNYKIESKKTFDAMFCDLKEYKTKKRLHRKTTSESVETDINQVLYIESIRPQNAKSLWELNDYLVSADQIFVSWADANYHGVPIVVIPSVWLSLILKISGRASQDDYKSFCMFMKLRQHQNEEDRININPIDLLSRISEKTIDVKLKESIITEIITNRSEYVFDTIEDYEESIDKAFDVVLSKEKGLHKEDIEQAVLQEKENNKKVFENYERQLSERKTNEDFSKEFADKLSDKKVTFFAENDNLLIALKVIICVLLLLPFVLACFNIGPFKEWATNLFCGETINERIYSAIFFIVEILCTGLFKTANDIWKYMSSEKRKNKLYKRYYKRQMKILEK